MNIQENIAANGYAGVNGVLTTGRVAKLRDALAPLTELNAAAGVRGLAARDPRISALAASREVRALVEPVLGPQARLVRSVLFNKTPEVNWQVAWHQDLSIAVRERADLRGFCGWTLKAGVVHVQPPTEILEQMLTVRLHLDAADAGNGALWVSPGSHRVGRISAGDAARRAEQNGKCVCAMEAGDALLFRPLLLHASRKAVNRQPRRVIHLEFCGVALPPPLEWNEAA